MDYKKIPFDNLEEIKVVVEIQKGSSNKYEVDEETGLLGLDFVFQNLQFPFNYGFIPNTKAEDGDPQDVLIFSSEPIWPGTIVKVKPIGIFKLKDRGDQDNKLLAVPVVDPMAKTLNDLADLGAEWQKTMADFYIEVSRQKNKTIELEGFFGREEALAELKKLKS